MPTPARFFDRLEDTRNLNKDVTARWDGMLYHHIGSCNGPGETVTVNLLHAIRNGTLCEQCDYNLAGIVNGDYDLSTFRYLTETHDLIHEPNSASILERFTEVETFIDYASDRTSGFNPAPTWTTDLHREALHLHRSLTRQVTSDPYKDLALHYASCSNLRPGAK